MLDNTSPVLRHAWHAAAFSEEVTDAPTQAWVAGEPWVLTRLDGVLTAFVDRCPHRLAPLSAGRVVTSEDGTSRLACGYHGWRYDKNGTCDLIPSLGRTGSISKRAVLSAPAGLTEAYGIVWLAPLDPLTPIPAFPEWDDAAFTTARSTTVRTHAGAAQIVDNFLDAAHFPFLHGASFGVEGAALDGGTVEREGDLITATFLTDYRDGGRVVDHSVRKTIGPSLNVHLRLELGDHARIGILLAAVPERDGQTRIVKLLARDDLGDDAGRLADFIKEEDQILTEDLTILERYPHTGVPLEPKAEVHTRADRLSVAWRGVMGEATSRLPASSTAATPW